MKIYIIKTTYKELKDAIFLQNLLLQEKLASCIQIQKIKSSYIWNNKIYIENEFALEIKTNKKNLKLVKSRILSNHEYEIPEILIFSVKASKEYFKWHSNSLK